MKTLKHLFDRNADWATAIKEQDPGFFETLAAQQNPEYLWIGCSDSRVAANQIIDLPPGEVFVQADGDILGKVPACLTVKEKALSVIVPNDASSSTLCNP